MSPPKNIKPPSITAGGPEGGTAVIDTAAAARNSTTDERMGQGPQNAGAKRAEVRGSDYHAAPRYADTIVDLDNQLRLTTIKHRKEKKEAVDIRDRINEIVRQWTTYSLDAKGIKQNAGELDRVMVGLYKSLAGLEGQKITSETITQIPRDQLDFDNLTIDQQNQLMDTFKSLERYVTAIIGMEITPLSPKEENKAAETVSGELLRYLKNGTMLMPRLMEGIWNIPGHALEKYNVNFKDKRKQKRIREDLKKLFKNGSGGYDVGAAGFDEFLTTAEAAGAEGFQQQMEFLLRLRKTRIRLWERLRPGIEPDSFNPESSENPELQRVMQRPEYKKYGNNFLDLPEHVRTMVEADVEMLRVQRQATKSAEEIAEEIEITLFERDDPRKRLSALDDEISKLEGKSGVEKKGDQKVEGKTKTKAEEESEAANKAYKKKKEEIDGFPDKVAAAQDDFNRWQAEYLRLEAERVSTLALYNSANAGDRTRILNLLDKTKEDLKAAIEKRDKAAVNKNTLDENKRKAESELEELEDKKKAAKKELDKSKGVVGKDKKKLDLLIGIRDIVKHDGVRNDQAWRILDESTYPLSIFSTKVTNFPNNYDRIRTVFAIEGDAFKDAVGQKNRDLRICLARALHLEFDYEKAKALDATEIKELDEMIWSKIQNGTQYQLFTTALRTWNTLLTSAITDKQNTPTLDYEGAEYGRPDIVGERKTKLLNYEEQRKEMRQILETMGYIGGVNTVIEYVEMPNKDILAIVVDTDGKNVVIDKGGKKLGTMERIESRIEDIGGVRTLQRELIPATSQEVAGSQGVIEAELGEKSILSYLSSTTVAGEYQYSILGLHGLTKIPEDLILKQDIGGWKIKHTNSAGAVSYQAMDEYLKTDKGKVVAREAALRYISRLERIGRRALTNQQDIGIPQDFQIEEEGLKGRLGMEWEDLWSQNPTNYDYQTMTVIFGDSADIQVVQNSVHLNTHIASRNLINSPARVIPPRTLFDVGPRRFQRAPRPVPARTIIDFAGRTINMRGRAINLPPIHLRSPVFTIPGYDVTIPRIHPTAPQINIPQITIDSPEIHIPVGNVTSTAATDLDGPMLNNAMEQQKGRLLESGFYTLAFTTQEGRLDLKNNFNTVSVSGITGGKYYEVGLSDDGRMILWDKTDPSILSPNAFDASDFINDKLISREITLQDARLIREAVGLEYFKAINRQTRR